MKMLNVKLVLSTFQEIATRVCN